MDDFTSQILADGGGWSESECLGNHAVVKVRASVGTLTTINAAASFVGVPGTRLDDPLSTLTGSQKTAIRNKLLALGYQLSELQAAFPNDLGTYQVGDVLRFALLRRLRARYDAGTDTIVCDGQEDPVRPVELVDAVV